MNSKFEDKISELIQLKAEGDYWDFKEMWHSDKADLLHDIICMANNLVNRDCYIIFGVTDDYEIVGINTENNRKNQQKIIDFLRNQHFDGGFRPNVYVRIITLESKKDKVHIIV